MARMRTVDGEIEDKAYVFNKVKVGSSTIRNDVFADIAAMARKTPGRRKYCRRDVERAIEDNDVRFLREISNVYFDRSGIYSRLCRYMAYLYRYDWYLTPITQKTNPSSPQKIVSDWYAASRVLENSRLKQNFGEIALKVIRNGCYYGYAVEQENSCFLQELPVNYCRARYEYNGKPAVEFNIRYFDDNFADAGYRIKVLKLFPKEFQRAYVAYKEGTLVRDFVGDEDGWFLPDVEKTVKFNLSNEDTPLFVSVIPHIMDLEDAQDLDKQKQAQQLLRLLVQHIPRDKNDVMLFDIDSEVPEIHQAAVNMLRDTIGINVLTTPLDVEVEDMSDNSNVSSVDQLDKVERTVYNEAGVSQMQFNTSGNLALEKSIANDEATMSDLLYQFESFGQMIIRKYNKYPKKVYYQFQLLPTTVYNYKDLSKQYKEQTMLGFSKLLPQVALGQFQTSVISTAVFENNLLNLDELFVAPQMSSTMSGNQSSNGSSGGSSATAKAASDSDNMGRPELEDDQKSDKTLANEAAKG